MVRDGEEDQGERTAPRKFTLTARGDDCVPCPVTEVLMVSPQGRASDWLSTRDPQDFHD